MSNGPTDETRTNFLSFCCCSCCCFVVVAQQLRQQSGAAHSRCALTQRRPLRHLLPQPHALLPVDAGGALGHMCTPQATFRRSAQRALHGTCSIVRFRHWIFRHWSEPHLVPQKKCMTVHLYLDDARSCPRGFPPQYKLFGCRTCPCRDACKHWRAQQLHNYGTLCAETVSNVHNACHTCTQNPRRDKGLSA